MKLARLIYASSASKKNTPEILQSIYNNSKSSNNEYNISGVLCYSTDYFLQCIEGPIESVNSLYKNILFDKRHTDVTLIEYVDIDVRNFEKWNMAYINFDSLEKKLIFKYSNNETFNPYNLNRKQALLFLKDISEYSKIIENKIKTDFEN
jgi:hypothetical protein